MVSAALHSLEPGRGGVILVGGAGVGKSTIASAMLSRTGSNFHVEHIRCSPVASRTPYGALSLLLSALDARSLGHPALLLEGLASVLIEHAKGKPLLIFLENAESLDPLTATVITQLASSGSVTLLITSQDIAAGSGEFLKLWTTGHLRRIDVEPLSLVEAGDLLQQTLEKRLSAIAIRTLWSVTGGNPLFLQVLAQKQISSGRLFELDGVWVLAGDVLFSEDIAEIVRLGLDALTPAQCRVLEVLALAGALPVKVLNQIVDPEDTDYLQEQEMVEVSPGPELTARISDRLTAEALRFGMPSGRSRELWERLNAVLDPSTLPPASLPHFACWGRDCGVDLDPSLLLRAAKAANEQCDPRSALALLPDIDTATREPAALLETVRALVALGELATASQVLGTISSVEGVPDPELRASLAIEHHKLARALPDETGQPTGVLSVTECVHEGMARAIHRVDPQTTMMVDRLILAKAEQAMFDGRHAQLPDELPDLYFDRDRLPDLRMYAGSLLCEAWSVTGRQQEAVTLVRDLLREIGTSNVSEAARDAVYLRAFNALLFAGEYAECLELLDGEEALGMNRVRWASRSELFRGLLYAYAGCSDLALESLVPALSQLSLRDPEGMAPYARAATAYAYSLQDETERAKHHLGLVRVHGYPSSWSIQRGTTYFTLLASSGSGLTEDVADELTSFASEDLANGNVSHALVFLSAATRLEGTVSGDMLASAARRNDGAYATLCRDFGAGLVLDDAPVLIRAAELAQEIGNPLFSYDAARASRAAAHRAGNRAGVRAARLVENTSYRLLRRSHGIEDRLALLTEFELALATAAAAGESSAALGRSLNLSARTIDWHLGKIFERLHISGRAQLREILC